MKPCEIVFVTGTDTGVGKTVVTALLTRELNRRGVNVRPMKPFSSGGREDAERLRGAVAGRWTLDAINPFAFQAPLTPVLAAAAEGRQVSLDECLMRIREAARDCDMLLVEGAGGLMSPLGPDYDTSTLVQAMRAKSILVSCDRLGVLNQVLTTVTAMATAGCCAPFVVLNRFGSEDPSQATNIGLLERLRPELVVETLPAIDRMHLVEPAAPRGERFLEKTLAGLLGRS